MPVRILRNPALTILVFASAITAFSAPQAEPYTWRNVAIGEVPEYVPFVVR